MPTASREGSERVLYSTPGRELRNDTGLPLSHGHHRIQSQEQHQASGQPGHKEGQQDPQEQAQLKRGDLLQVSSTLLWWAGDAQADLLVNASKTPVSLQTLGYWQEDPPALHPPPRAEFCCSWEATVGPLTHESFAEKGSEGNRRPGSVLRQRQSQPREDTAAWPLS